MAWSSAQAVTARDIFKLQNESVVQSAEALGTSEKKRKKTQILPPIVISCQGYLNKSFLKS
jgi:ABC-type microcin C transport system permease subunit YejE